MVGVIRITVYWSPLTALASFIAASSSSCLSEFSTPIRLLRALWPLPTEGIELATVGEDGFELVPLVTPGLVVAVGVFFGTG